MAIAFWHQKALKNRLQIPANLRFSLAVIVLLLGLNFVLRTIFLLYNTAQARALSWNDIGWGYVVGLRFDLATILIFNGIILLFLTLPLAINKRRITYKIANLLLIAVNFPILIVNSIDVVYYGFAEKRMTHELFTTKSDFGSFKPDLLMQYWWLFVIFFFMIFFLYKVLNRIAVHYLGKAPIKSPLSRQWMWAIVFFGFLYTGMRGGWQDEPLAMQQAYVGDSFFSGSLGLNSAFTILSAVDWEKEPVELIPETEAVRTTREMVRNRFDGPFLSNTYPLIRKTNFDQPEKRNNVVFLIIESLNAEDVGVLNGLAGDPKSLTPNLDTLARHARVYTRYFANGTRSVESLPALLNSIPDIFDRPTIGSHFIHNTHYGLPEILKERGYSTAFYCGSHNGTMGFDKYATASGIEAYYGMNEYPNSERDFDGYWGCADYPFLQWMATKQNENKGPFMSVFFSLSNHHPFNLPKDHSADIAASDLGKMQKTIKYTDRALGAYFETVRKEKWYENTIFIITGDHCFHEASDPNRKFIDNFNVPLFIISPDLEPGFDDRIGQHISIMPTIIELMQLNTIHASTGLSLLGDVDRSFAINNLMNVATLAKGDIAYSSSFERMQSVCSYELGKWNDLTDEKLNPSQDITLMEHQLRCLFQVYHNTRVNNTLQLRPSSPISLAD